MNILKFHKILLIIFMLWLICEVTVFASKNKITIERFVCQPSKPGFSAQQLVCNVKYISRTNLKIHFHVNLTAPVTSIWMHGVFYHKFNGLVYSKFPIDLWENFCDWMDGKSIKSYLLDWSVGKLLQYSNLNHSCPYVGLSYVKVDNISIDNLPFEPLIPSGRYRLDVSFTEADRVPTIEFQVYFSVSDHRLEVV